MEIKREVERGFTFTLTSDRSCIASILFANVNFAHVYTRKNYATVEINPKAHHKAGPTLALKSQIIMAISSSSRADERVGAE